MGCHLFDLGHGPGPAGLAGRAPGPTGGFRGDRGLAAGRRQGGNGTQPAAGQVGGLKFCFPGPFFLLWVDGLEFAGVGADLCRSVGE